MQLIMPSPRWIKLAVLLLAAATSALQPSPAKSAGKGPLVLILDASGSMWGQIEGENKIVIARRALRGFVEQLPTEMEVALVAYGHRREGDCADIETVVPLGPLDREMLVGRIDALQPKGKTPITGSVRQALEIVRESAAPATIVLVSDGIETCDGDPCASIRAAKATGVEFLMHVVGFGMGDADVSELECTAQAAGGLYFDADDADELAAALDQAIAIPADEPLGYLAVGASADGELTDVHLQIVDRTTAKEVAHARTYRAPATNPRITPLPAGNYDVEVWSIELEGQPRRSFEVAIAEGDTVTRQIDFSSGELAVGVTRNGELSDATVRIYLTGSGEQVAAGRTYTGAHSNPAVFRLTPGIYDVGITSVEIDGKPGTRIAAIQVEASSRTERQQEFASGVLKIGAKSGDALVDVTVHVVSLATGRAVAQGRTYTADNSNPRSFVLPPGSYKVHLKAVRLQGKPTRELETTVETGGETVHTVDFAS